MLLPRQRFLHFATMRGGRTDVPAEEPGRVDAPARVGRPTENMRKHAEQQRVEPDDESIATAERIMEQNRPLLDPAPAKVSMHVPARKGRKR